MSVPKLRVFFMFMIIDVEDSWDVDSGSLRPDCGNSINRSIAAGARLLLHVRGLAPHMNCLKQIVRQGFAYLNLAAISLAMCK